MAQTKNKKTTTKNTARSGQSKPKQQSKAAAETQPKPIRREVAAIVSAFAALLTGIAQNVELHIEQFLELETLTRRLHIVGGTGIMNLDEGLSAGEEPVGDGEEGRQCFGQRFGQFADKGLGEFLHPS